MGIEYAIFNHTKKEYVVPDRIPVDAADPTTYPYSAFIANLLMHSWRHDHVVLLDDSGDFQCEWKLEKEHKDVSVGMWNEFVLLYKDVLPDLKEVE